MSPVLALVIANIIWGAASPIFKFALQDVPPFTMAFLRFYFAAWILMLPGLLEWRHLSLKDFAMIFLAGFFGITLNIALFFLGLEKTASINAPVIASAGPVILFLISIIFLREKPKTGVFGGMLLSLLGVLIIIFSPILFSGRKLEIGQVEGNLFFLGATIAAVIHPVLQKKISPRIGSSQITLVSFVLSAAAFLPLMLGELRHWSFSQLDGRGWTGIIFGVFLSSALAYYLYTYGVSRIKAQEIGIFTYIDPVIAVLIAIPLLAEYPDPFFFIGSLLVLAGILIAENRVHYHPLHRFKIFDFRLKNKTNNVE